YAACGAVRSLLYDMARVPLRPLPTDLVRTRSLVQSLPPFRIRLATKAPRHSLNDVARIRHNAHSTRLAQGFETERGCRNLRLLVRSLSQIFTHAAPNTSITQKRNSRRASLWCKSVAKT